MSKFIESLENRQMLSASHPSAPSSTSTGGFVPGAYGPVVVSQNGTTLTIDNAHDLQINEPVDGTVEVIDKSGGIPAGSVNYPSTLYAGITTLVINGTSGGDIISAGMWTVNTTINGFAGADQIAVTSNNTANILVNGGDDNDVLSGQRKGTGTVVINGQNGKDSFTKFGTGTVTFNQ